MIRTPHDDCEQCQDLAEQAVLTATELGTFGWLALGTQARGTAPEHWARYEWEPGT